MRSKSYTFMQDFVKRTYVISTESRKTNVVIPGSHGLPGWVSHNSIGHEIRIELPRNWYEDNNFLGFALFYHHVPLDDDDDYICETIDGNTLPPDIDFPTVHLWISHGDQFENNIRRIPIGIIQLSQLNTLIMNHCLVLEEIPELPKSLRCIKAHGCPCLETLSSRPILWSYLLNCFKSQIQVRFLHMLLNFDFILFMKA